MSQSVRKLPRDMLAPLLADRGITFEAAREAIADYDADHVLIAFDHPAWPRRGERSAGPAKPDPIPAEWRERWWELGRRARKPVKDIDAELAWIARLGDGCGNCAVHWAQYRAEHPPTIDTPANYWRWRVDAQNAVNRIRGVKELTYAEAEQAEPIDVHNSATGLGDAVSGLYAVCGLAEATGKTIIYHAHSAAWIARASHPNVIVLPIEDGAEGPDMNAGSVGYNRQISNATTRTQAYCDNLAAALKVARFAPKRPPEIKAA